MNVQVTVRTNQVVGHEGKLELVVVLVVNLVQRELLGVVVLPEPRHNGRASVLVGVKTLEVLKVDGRSVAKSSKRVLRLLGGLLGGLLSSGSRSGGSLGSLGLLLLLGRRVLDALLSEDGVRDDSLEDGLVDDSVVPPGDGGVLGAPFLVKDSSKSTEEEGGGEKVSQGNTLANEVGVGSEVRLEDTGGLQSSLGSLVDVLLVIAVEAKERTVPTTEAGQILSVDEGQPAEDGSVVLFGLTQKSGLLVLGCHLKIQLALGFSITQNSQTMP